MQKERGPNTYASRGYLAGKSGKKDSHEIGEEFDQEVASINFDFA